MSTTKKSLLTVIGLILATTLTLAAMETMGSEPLNRPIGDDLVSMSSKMAQDKILKNSDGRVTVSLKLAATRQPALDRGPVQPADLVIVLDRSGSMQGRKLSDARRAVVALLNQLGPEDRLALVTYENGVQTQSTLVPMTEANRMQMRSSLKQIYAAGGTNLGGGLDRGMALLMRDPVAERQRKVILISDGMANQGVIDPYALGIMASAAVENRFTISTVGVGLDFNEVLMTAIADQGAGRYHFLKDPEALARVFEDEFQAIRQVAATDVNIRVPLAPGVRLVSAGGYPIRHERGSAVIHPGNLLFGQSKTLYLTFKVPTMVEQKILLGRVRMQYQHLGEVRTVKGSHPLTVACISDPSAVLASIKKDPWADQVVQEEFSRLKEAIATEIRNGDKPRAQARIQDYATKQETINAVVGSGKVANNLKTDLQDLRQRLDETFTGAPAVVAEKRKQAAKSLQYDGYRIRRDNQSAD